MSKKAIFWSIVMVSIIGSAVFLYNRPEEPSSFVYDDFLKEYPDLDSAQQTLLANAKYAELGTRLEELAAKEPDYSKGKIYLQYVAMRAYVNSARSHGGDMESARKAIRLGRDIIGDQRVIDTAPNFVAFSIDVIDRLAYPSTPQAVRNEFLHDSFFSQKFADQQAPENINAFRRNLLEYGNGLNRVTNIKMKLALLAIDPLRKSKDSSTGMTIQKEQVDLLMREAESSLALDRNAGSYPFGQRGYLAETLFTRAWLGEEYESITKETPFGPVDALYQEALLEAREHSPSFTHMIQTTYDRFLKKRGL